MVGGSGSFDIRWWQVETLFFQKKPAAEDKQAIYGRSGE